MEYSQLLEELNAHKEEAFALFQRKLIPTKQKILGVRTPIMRSIAKKYAGEPKRLFSFPDEFYEVTFIKLTVISSLPYADFALFVEKCVELMDNWATCDCFKAKCIKKHREEFLPILERIFEKGGEYSERYPLVVLLNEYIEEAYMPVIRSFLSRANTKYYYVHMAASWLTAEVLIKRYEDGLDILNGGVLDNKTHDKTIQKAIESYRLSKERKEFLRSLKINKVR